MKIRVSVCPSATRGHLCQRMHLQATSTFRDDSASQDAGDFGHLISALNARYLEIINGKLDVKTLADLLELELDQEIADQLSVLVGDGGSEQAIVVAFLAALSESGYGKEFSRHVKRLIRAAEKRTTLNVSLKRAVQNIVGCV